MVRRLPLAGEEKETLHASLMRHREAVLWKLEGLQDEQLRRPMVRSGTSLLGLVKHLAGVEYQWFGRTFGRQTEALETDPVADMTAGPDETSEDIVAFYRRACTFADQVIDELRLDDQGTGVEARVESAPGATGQAVGPAGVVRPPLVRSEQLGDWRGRGGHRPVSTSDVRDAVGDRPQRRTAAVGGSGSVAAGDGGLASSALFT